MEHRVIYTRKILVDKEPIILKIDHDSKVNKVTLIAEDLHGQELEINSEAKETIETQMASVMYQVQKASNNISLNFSADLVCEGINVEDKEGLFAFAILGIKDYTDTNHKMLCDEAMYRTAHTMSAPIYPIIITDKFEELDETNKQAFVIEIKLATGAQQFDGKFVELNKVDSLIDSLKSAENTAILLEKDPAQIPELN